MPSSRSDEYDKALEFYQQALASTVMTDPLNRSILLRLQVLILNKLGRYVEAIESADQAFALDLNNQFAMDAKLAAEKSLEIAQTKMIAFYMKGSEYYARNDFNKAIEYYKLAYDNCRHDRKGQSSFLSPFRRTLSISLPITLLR